jgi:alkylhydroperoxidase family enzyme
VPRIEPVPWDDLPEEVRTHIEEGRRRGTVTGDSMPVFAHSPYVALDILDRSEGRFRQGRHGGRLAELIRLRSAQIAACGPCSAARKDPSVTEDDVACLTDPEHSGLPRRETLAINIVDLMATDHDAIDEGLLLQLAEEFDTEEIVELLYRAGQAVGSHRFVHVLDVLADTKPVLAYDAETVRASWARAYGVASAPTAHAPG